MTMEPSTERMAQSVSDETSASPLMMFILAALSSMLAPTLADLGLARLAAREAIDAHRARGQHELLTIGQIVGFAVAALDTLRLSMPEDVSMAMKLRLRGNANGLNRSSCSCTRLLERDRVCKRVGGAEIRYLPVVAGENLSTRHFDTDSESGVDGAPAPARVMEKADAPDRMGLTGMDWADAMQSVAVTLQAEAVSVSPEQRKIDAMWIEALNGVGAELMGRTRQSSGLDGMRSRLMAGLEPGVAPHLFGKPRRKWG